MTGKLFVGGSICLTLATFVGIGTKSGWTGLVTFAVLIVAFSVVSRPLEK